MIYIRRVGFPTKDGHSIYIRGAFDKNDMLCTAISILNHHELLLFMDISLTEILQTEFLKLGSGAPHCLFGKVPPRTTMNWYYMESELLHEAFC